MKVLRFLIGIVLLTLLITVVMTTNSITVAKAVAGSKITTSVNALPMSATSMTQLATAVTYEVPTDVKMCNSVAGIDINLICTAITPATSAATYKDQMAECDGEDRTVDIASDTHFTVTYIRVSQTAKCDGEDRTVIVNDMGINTVS